MRIDWWSRILDETSHFKMETITSVRCAVFSSVSRLPASPPSACLQFLFHIITFVLVIRGPLVQLSLRPMSYNALRARIVLVPTAYVAQGLCRRSVWDESVLIRSVSVNRRWFSTQVRNDAENSEMRRKAAAADDLGRWRGWRCRIMAM